MVGMFVCVNLKAIGFSLKAAPHLVIYNSGGFWQDERSKFIALLAKEIKSSC
jgi:hypothetical protein